MNYSVYQKIFLSRNLRSLMPGKDNNALAKLQQEFNALQAEHREFAYIVSHDLSGPFRQIKGFANIILSNHGDKFDDKTKRHLDLIIGGSEKGKGILEALLAYSRFNDLNTPFASVDCDICLFDVQTKRSEIIVQSGADIHCDFAPTISADEAQINQLFYHLIHNALLYRKPECSPKVVIKVKVMEKVWQFCITDNGIGIRGKLIEKIFTPLKRGVSDKEFPGIRMGLTFSKAIAKRHGGLLWVESEFGEGSSFYFTIEKEIHRD